MLIVFENELKPQRYAKAYIILSKKDHWCKYVSNLKREC